MPKKPDYAAMYTKRKDGRYQAVIPSEDKSKPPRYIYDRDPETLYNKVQQAAITPPLLFRAVAEEWREYHNTRIAYKTAEAYTAPHRRIVEHFGAQPLAEVTAQQIQAYIAELSKQDYARRTVQMHLDIIRMICNYAILQGKATTNPAQAVEIPNGLYTAKRELPEDKDIEKVKASVDKTLGLFAYFLLYTGLRKGEALAVTYGDIDFKNKLIHVNKAVMYEGNRPVLKATKTEAGTRDVILINALAEKLDKKGRGLIFGIDGAPFSKMQFRDRWEAYQAETGLKITPHQLRHAYATILYDAQIDEKAAQELLGHSSITVTKNIYTHIRQSRRKDTAKTLNAYVNKKPNVKVCVRKRGSTVK